MLLLGKIGGVNTLIPRLVAPLSSLDWLGNETSVRFRGCLNGFWQESPAW